METTIVFVAVAVALALFAKAAIKFVPQSQEWVVTRLGARHKVLKAGPGFIIPVLDRIHAKVFVADHVLNPVTLDVVSADNVVFSVDLMVLYRVKHPEEAIFRVNSIEDLVIGLVRSLARAEIGKVELDSIQRDRDSLNIAIREALAQAGDDYGVLISRAEITDVKLQESTQAAMAEVLEAERARRATITRAEGDKRAVELRADAELYEEKRRAEAIEVVAAATARANALIGEAIRVNGAEAAQFQIAEGQIRAAERMAASPNSKIIMIPGDVTDGMTRGAALLLAERS